jgi:hypothetical protein
MGVVLLSGEDHSNIEILLMLDIHILLVGQMDGKLEIIPFPHDPSAY